MCIHGDSAPELSPKAQAKLRVQQAKDAVKTLTAELRAATKTLSAKQREYQNN